MNSALKSFSIGFVTAAGLATSAISAHAQDAMATISDTAAGGGVFDYTITLFNTGTTSLDSFWYAWTASDDGNLTTAPSNPGSSLGWADVGFDSSTSIAWEGNSGDALAAGKSATFTFTSTETPSAITTSPSGESVAYVGNIDFSQGSPGDSTGVFSPVLQAAPEPSLLGLISVGLFAFLSRAIKRGRFLVL
ncbi:MAG TPA: hypothetical protein VMF08_22500 [Candidatus Sulfotelmatobacter sp.]|nr:hypothetical protein [Candidatus Sulfotelmatobacter sp.]